MHGTKLSVIPAAGKAAQSPKAPQLGMSKIRTTDERGYTRMKRREYPSQHQSGTSMVSQYFQTRISPTI
jgi:hypothetical protein